MNPITALLGAVGAIMTVFFTAWGRAIAAGRCRLKAAPQDLPGEHEDARFPTALQIGVGFVTDFFDTLGIGCYAPTTSIFKLKKMVSDRVIPGTLTIGHTPATLFETIIFTTVIPMDVLTLFAMIASSVLGAWLGAGVVAKLPKRKIQIGMGCALIAAAGLLLMTQLQLFPVGGDALGATGWKLAVAVAVNAVLGALMTLGIGMFAPVMILVTLLGMNPRVAFPIMMSSCAFLMPVAALQFIREKSYAMRPALGLAVGGVPAVLLAAFIVKELPLYALRWLVIVVVLYTASAMLRSAFAVVRASEVHKSPTKEKARL
jgi:uncharacterized membrane protein YfcA